jgi:hypothetical protein
MATEYKILGQVQAAVAPAQENINLFPDPNHERYTSSTSFNPHDGQASVATDGALNSIWVWNPSSHNTSHAYQHWPLNSNSHSGSQTSGRTGYVRFESHQNTGGSHSQGVEHARSWYLDPAKTGSLIAGKTYTINLWAHAHSDSHNSHAQHGQNSLQFWDGTAWNPIVAGFASQTMSHLNNVDNHHGGIYQIQEDENGNRASWSGGWRRWYKTFTATANSKFQMRVNLGTHNSDVWQRLYVDNVYVAEGAIPKALIPAKAPDGTSGNPLAIHTQPFTTRSEGWSGTAYQSATTRKFTGEWQTIYTVPDLVGASAVCSTITITNTASTTNTYRIAVQKFGEVLTHKHILAFDHNLAAQSMETLTLGLTLGRQDKVLVQSDSDRMSFSLFGSENTL